MKILLFMYRRWLSILAISVAATVLCLITATQAQAGFLWQAAALLPLQITVTVYYISMLFVRRRYSRRDEVRCHAHYLREWFCALTLISWLLPLMMLLASEGF